MRGGRDFVLTLMKAWQAADCFTHARSQALNAHMATLDRRRRGPRPEAALPGSYSWKALRNETEHRAASGEALTSILRDLRRRHAHDHADAPSERTVRRWYTDRRWARGIRTALRPGFERRDHAHASRAQRERAHVRRLREAHAHLPAPPGRTPPDPARPFERRQC